MDNRRLSARAEMGAAAPYGQTKSTSFLDRAIELTTANWEIIFYIGLVALAIFTRVLDLGPRALHHDESIHAYYSNQYYRGGGYNYDPVYHGPFLYNIVALGFFLFGVTDAMARIMPAIFGIFVIALCWFLRPFIGRAGALIAMALLIFSPSVSYYSRSLRHDIFAVAGIMALFVSILWFMRTHQARWVYFGAIGFAIALTSHELTYIVTLIFVLYLALAAFAFPFFANRAIQYSRAARRGDEEVNPVTSALQSLGRQRWTTLGAIAVFLAIFTLMYTNMLTKFTYQSNTFAQHDANGNPVAGTAPTVPFFTAFIEGPAYWLTQQHVSRGNQPTWYYLMLMPIYEPLALLAGISTIIWLIVRAIMGGGDTYAPGDSVDANVEGPIDSYGLALPSIYTMRGFALGFLAFWSIGGLIAFSIAGERLPWLLMQSAVPFSLLAAAGMGHLISRMEWRAILKQGGAILAVVVVLFLFAAFAFMRVVTGNMGPATADVAIIRAVLVAIFTFGLLALAAWLAYKILPSRAVGVVALTFAILLTLYGIRSMVLLNYRHGDVPIEMLVYTQSAPDVPLVADRILRLSRDETAFDAGRTASDVTGGYDLQVAIDQSVEWPFDWYLRDMRQISYFNESQWQSNAPGTIPPSVPVIIASDETVANQNFQTAIKDKYTPQKFVLRWWFPEEVYKSPSKDPSKNGELEGDLGKAIQWVFSPAFAHYLLYRDPGMPLGSTNFTLYVRDDLAVKVGMGAPAGGTTSSGTSTTGVDLSKAPTNMNDQQQGADRGNFNQPRGIAYDGKGNLYVVDTSNFRVQEFDKTGKWINMFGTQGTGDGQFAMLENAPGTGPSGIAVDKQGNVYVADTWNHRIQKFDSTGKFLAKWGTFFNLSDASTTGQDQNSGFYGPRDVAVGPDGNVYVTDTGNKRIMIFDTNGKFVRKIDSGMSPTKKSPDYAFSQPGELNEPIGLTVDSKGNVYVADSVNKRIQKFDNAGKYVTSWAIPNGGWDAGPTMEPFLAVDSADDVYASAPTSKTVLKFSPTGQLLGQKNKQAAITLKLPTGIAIADDNVYAVDTGGPGVVSLGPIQP